MVKRYALMNGKVCVNVILLDLAANPNWVAPNGYAIEEDLTGTRQIDPPATPQPKVPPPLGGPFQ